MAIYKPTEFLRATVTQEARIVLDKEEGCPPGSFRRVQLLVPPSPRVSAVVDKTPEQIGPNREYKLPVMSPGAQIIVELLPEQFITAVANSEFAELALIVEYKHGLGGM